MDAMIEAGFDTVFVGIETPNPKALLKTKKAQNTSKNQDNYLFQRRSQDSAAWHAGPGRVHPGSG